MTAKSMMTIVAASAFLSAAPSSAHVIVVQPNGGESFTGGQVVTIKWCIAVAHALQSWTIKYDTAQPGVNTACGNVAGTWVTIASGIPPTCTNGTGGVCFLGPNPCCMQYLWTVPQGINSSEVKIRVAMINSGTNYYDLSDAPFTITPATSAPIAAGPPRFDLEQNEPNPLGPRTTIGYSLPRDGDPASLKVYDVRGELIRTLVDFREASGPHTVVWDGLDQAGAPVGSGVYFYRLESGDRVQTREMVVVR